jgi:hypothetical protein
MDHIVFARNARGVQPEGLRASRRARLDCPARDNRVQMQVPAGAEGASAVEGARPKAARRPRWQWPLRPKAAAPLRASRRA